MFYQEERNKLFFYLSTTLMKRSLYHLVPVRGGNYYNLQRQQIFLIVNFTTLLIKLVVQLECGVKVGGITIHPTFHHFFLYVLRCLRD